MTEFSGEEESPTSTSDNQQPSYIVGIGASAGGLEAIEAFFDNMPTDTGMAFVLVQHLSPDFKSLMSELLGRRTAMTIRAVEDGMPVLANEVYLIPPRKNMILRDGKLHLTEQKGDGGLNLPIDIFFDSLAEDAPNRAIAVILSGTGSDGSRGLQRVHESGGLVLGQSAATAGFDGMPRSAKATGMVDVVTSPAAMPARILAYVEHPQDFQRGVEDEDHPQIDDDALGSLFRLFRKQFGIDFHRYRATTINRRIDRRLQMTGCRTLENYLRRLEREPAELDVLYRDLLVEVTQFFRDSAAFARLRHEVIPDLIRQTPIDGQLRFWVPACATGEEAYSLAMIASDCHRQNPGRGELDIKIFATDVHQTSLHTASAGVYSADSVRSTPEEYRQRYFSRSQDLYHVSPAIRQMVIFAPHDITSDPPFTKIDLISCRNALIYLKPEVQRKVIALFHFGLRVGGVLFLGPSETLGEAACEFDPIDSQWRIFSKLRDVRLAQTDTSSYSQPLRQVIHSRPSFVSTATRPEPTRLIPNVHEALLREYVPPSLLINSRGELIHTFGDARSFVRQPEGKATLDILKMVDGDLRMALSDAMRRVAVSDEPVVMKLVPAQIDGEKVRIQLKAKPYRNEGETMVLISFEREKTPLIESPEVINFEPDGQSAERIITLERELAYSRESLQATVEELETSNEELQSTNEELVASNEELQSTNEELHSVNEELHTVNAEHQRKIQELTELTSDMDNLLQSTQIGTIFLDGDLRIRKFTPAVASAFYMMPQDIGRPIEHIASNLDVADLLSEVKQVLRTGMPIELEARNRDDQAFLLRIQPYVDETSTTSGVVLTCVDVTAILQSYDEIRRNAETLELTDRDLQEFAYAVSHDLQAPLRHIGNHVRQIRAEVDSLENEEATASIDAINTSLARMDSMIAGLLRYSRVYSRGNPFRETDLNEVVRRAVEKLRVTIDETQAEIEFGALPSLAVDPEQMVTVFEQLIDNAIKYAREMPPRVWISAEKHHEHWRLKISDDGIGIAPQHRSRVLVVFERLEFRVTPGEGMGLPICKRIVQRHGGNLKVLDGPSLRGTTIQIELPINQAEHKTDALRDGVK